jgi:hypothetical protein
MRHLESSEKDIIDGLRDSVNLDVDEPSTLISGRDESGNPTTSIVASPTSIPEVSVSQIYGRPHACQHSLQPQLPFTMPSSTSGQLNKSVASPSLPSLQNRTERHKAKISTWVLRAVFHRFRNGKRRRSSASTDA